MRYVLCSWLLNRSKGTMASRTQPLLRTLSRSVTLNQQVPSVLNPSRAFKADPTPFTKPEGLAWAGLLSVWAVSALYQQQQGDLKDDLKELRT